MPPGADEHFARCAGIEDPEKQLRQVGYNVLTDQRLRTADAWLSLHPLDDPMLAERSRRVREQTMNWSVGLLRRLGFDEPSARKRSRFLYTGYLGLVAEIESQVDQVEADDIRGLVDVLVDLTTARALGSRSVRR